MGWRNAAHHFSAGAIWMAKQAGRNITTRKAKSKATANAAASIPKSPGEHSNHVITIRALDPQNKEIFEASLPRTTKLEQLAEKWTYILRARSRWSHDLEQRKYFGSQAVDDLKDLGVKLEFIERLSTVIHIEVELHHWDTQDAEAARIGETASEIPWEYLISAATRSVGRFQPLLITRLFRNGRPAVALPPPELVLFVESAPGRLKDLYEFDDEEDRIRAAVNATGAREGHMEILNTPQLSELSGHARRRKWEAIHVSGVDTQQAGWFLEGFYKDLREHHPDRLQRRRQFLRQSLRWNAAARRPRDPETGLFRRPRRCTGESSRPALRGYAQSILFRRPHCPRTGQSGSACRAWFPRRDQGRTGRTLLPGVLLGMVPPW
jgi:hypothetical protein